MVVPVWWGLRSMRCCGRRQLEGVSSPLQLPASWQVAAATGGTSGEFGAELIQLGGIDGRNALDLQPLGEELSTGG